MYKECKSLKEVAKVDASSKNRLNECDGGGGSFLPVVAVILILPLNSPFGTTLRHSTFVRRCAMWKTGYCSSPAVLMSPGPECHANVSRMAQKKTLAGFRGRQGRALVGLGGRKHAQGGISR